MEISFNWIGGATFILTAGDLKIAVDPVLCEKGTVQDYFWFRSERLEQPIYDKKDFEHIDLWLITHNHEDHLDPAGLSTIPGSARVVSNGNSVKKLQQRGIGDLSVLAWKGSKKYAIKGYEIEIEAIPAIHGINPLSALLAGKVNGYFLTITRGDEHICIYITGDTVYKRKVVKALKGRKIDLMIPNMGAASQGSWIMTLTLNAGMLSKMLEVLNPEVVIPVHYGTFTHYREPVESVKALGDKRIRILEVGSTTTLTFTHGG